MKFLKALLVVVVCFLLFVWAIGSFLGPDAPSATTGCERAGAIVAVSGGDTAARAAEAIQLYQNGWGDLLIFSGAAADKSGPSNAAVMKQQAIDAGIDANQIIVEELSETTTQNAEQTTNIFKEHGIKSAILDERRLSLTVELSA